MKRLSPYRISSRVLRILSAAILIMFVAFFFIGYDQFFEEDSRFRAPMLTDTLIVFTGIFVLGTIAVSLWSAVRSIKQGASFRGNDSGMMSSYIIYGALSLLILLIAGIGILSGSSAPMKVNGELFSDTFWLRAADMFVILCLSLIVITITVAAFSSWKSLHK